MPESFVCGHCGLAVKVPKRQRKNNPKCQTCGSPLTVAVLPPPTSAPAFLGLLAVAAWLVGGVIFFQAKSAIHEIEAFVLLLIGSVLIVGAAVCSLLDANRQTAIEQAAMLRGKLDAIGQAKDAAGRAA